jgi:flagellar hook-length control protein FliK
MTFSASNTLLSSLNSAPTRKLSANSQTGQFAGTPALIGLFPALLNRSLWGMGGLRPVGAQSAKGNRPERIEASPAVIATAGKQLKGNYEIASSAFGRRAKTDQTSPSPKQTSPIVIATAGRQSVIVTEGKQFKGNYEIASRDLSGLAKTDQTSPSPKQTSPTAVANEGKQSNGNYKDVSFGFGGVANKFQTSLFDRAERIEVLKSGDYKDAQPPSRINPPRSGAEKLSAGKTVHKSGDTADGKISRMADPTIPADVAKGELGRLSAPTLHSQANGHIPKDSIAPLPIEPSSFVQSVRLTLTGGQREIVVRLHPEILGQAVIAVHQDEDGLRLEFKLERAEARQAVEAQSAQLKEALAAAGFQNVQIDIQPYGWPDDRPDRLEEHSEGQSRRQSEHRENLSQEHLTTPDSQPPITRLFGYNTFEIAA